MLIIKYSHYLVSRPFWAEHGVIAHQIARIIDLGTSYQYEDEVWQLWTSLAHWHFPMFPDTPGGPTWLVSREPYRGNIIARHLVRPDVVIIKVVLDINSGTRLERDYLWVECKAPTNDRQSGWKNALLEVTQRLEVAHPSRMVYFVIAIGLKCAFFV